METIDLKDKKVTSIDIFPDKVVINMGYEFKIGDYVTIETTPKKLRIGILKNTLTIGNEGFPIFAGLGFSKDLYINSIFGVWPKNIVRKSTIEEIRQLNSALEKANKRWNAEKKCLEERFTFKDGDILSQGDVVVIHHSTDFATGGIVTYAGTGKHHTTYETGKGWGKIYRYKLATEEEKQFLFAKLREEGKKWNPVKKCIEDIPIIGKPAIFWDKNKEKAIVDILLNINEQEHCPYPYYTKGSCYKNAILCESLEQYLEFIKS